MLRKVSVEWHRFLQFESAHSSRLRKGSVTARMRDVTTEEDYRQWKIMFKPNLIKQLHQLIGPTARFRSVQKVALTHIMGGNSPVVVIMGTGAGKSLLFMLPASCSSGVTVMIVPLIWLRQDMRAR